MIERTMKIKILLLTTIVSSAFGFINPTAPENTKLIYYSSDFTDSDGDGMTDVAENLYGFNPNDSSSFPSDHRTVSMDFDDTELENQEHFTNNKMYFTYDFSNSGLDEEGQAEFTSRCQNFLSKMLPIMEHKLGTPNESFVCRVERLSYRLGYWMSYSGGRHIRADNTWLPRLFVHEILHGWKGDYKYNGHAHIPHWYRKDQNLAGYEEGVCEGLAFELIEDYIRAYPFDTETEFLLTKTVDHRWSKFAFNYDLIKNSRYTATSGNKDSGYGLWPGDGSQSDRYQIGAVTFQILMNKNPNFYKLVTEHFKQKVATDSNWKPTHDNLQTLFAEIVPEIYGQDTKTFLNSIPMFSTQKLEGLYSIRRYRRTNHSQEIYVAYGDSYRHEFFYKLTDETLSLGKIPEYIPLIKNTSDQYVPILEKQPYTVNVNTIHGESVLNYNGITNSTTSDSKPVPTRLGKSTPSELRYPYFPRGLYREDIEFTNFTEYTENAKESYYFMGFQGLEPDSRIQPQDELIVFVGIDSPTAKFAEIQIANKYMKSEIVNGTALFRLFSFGRDSFGEFEVKVTGQNALGNEVSHKYVRYLIPQGDVWSARLQKFLVIDKDFDGVEDLYDNDVVELSSTSSENYSDINSNANDLMNFYGDEVVNYPFEYDFNESVLSISTVVPFNRSEVFYAELFVNGVSTISNDIVNGNVTFDLQYYDSVESVSVRFKNHAFGEFIEESEFVELDVSNFKDSDGEIDWSELVVVDVVNPTESVNGETVATGYETSSTYETTNVVQETTSNEDYTLSYETNNQVEESVTNTNIIQVETNTSIVIVADVVSSETDGTNTIINTTESVVIVENTEVVTAYDENTTYEQDDNIIVVESGNVTLYANDDTTSELNSTDSVVVVTETEILIEEDTSKQSDTNNEITLNETPDAPPALQNAWDNATSIGNNWYVTEWFGYFYKVEGNNWVYSTEFGWLYADWTNNFDSIWFWHEELGWIWTSSAYFPYVYSPKNNNWMYIVEGGYYDFNTSAWVVFE
jgi:hypothetical protein